MRVPSRRARRSAPFGAQRLTPVSVRTSRMSAAGRPTASLRAHPVRRWATGFSDSTVASRSTMIRAWGNCSNACSESVRSLAMSPKYRRAYFRLQLLQPALQPERPRTQDVLVEAGIADGLAAEPGLEAVEAKPRMVGRRLFRDSPPVVAVAAERLEVEHRLPMQHVVRHQLPLVVARPAEQVVGGGAEPEDHDPRQGLPFMVGEIKAHLVARAKQVDGGLVIGGARQVNLLPLAGVGRQLREGRDIPGSPNPDALLFSQVQVVAGLRFEARPQAVRVDVDP